MVPSSPERSGQPRLCVPVPNQSPDGESGLRSCLVYDIPPQGGDCAPHPRTTYPPQIPWPVLPGRGRRGIPKSMAAESACVIEAASSTPWSVVNTSTPVGSSENVHSRARGCCEPGRHHALRGSSGEQTFKRYKLDHMVPSGFPTEYWPRGEAKSPLRKTNGRKAGILMSIH